MRFFELPLYLVLSLCAHSVYAQSTEEESAPEPERPETSTRINTVQIAGAEVRYRSTAGTLTLKEEEGSERAHVFFVAYERIDEGANADVERPVTFTFNGGPGSSSVWLHLGLLGPQRVAMDEEGFALPPPGGLVENEYSLLDHTDLVFIDPVMTGYSRPAKDIDKGDFHGLSQDAKSVAEFIRLWTTQNERWSSPKFLCGESYGTTRAAALAGELQGRHGMYLNGIVLVSSILDFSTARFDAGNDLPYVLFLPTYAATAWYHGKIDRSAHPELLPFLAEVEAYAAGEYKDALFQGSKLGEQKRREIAETLMHYTGLSMDYLLSTDLRIHIQRFVKELRRDEDITVGRLDSRFRGRDRDSAGAGYEFDPSYAAIQGPFTAAANDYVRRTLGYESDLPYEILTGRVHPWSYGDFENRYVNVAETLRREMERNPALKIYVANGFYDLATPYYATRYTFDHLSFDADLVERVTMGDFESGHMMYIRRADLAGLRQDLVQFYE